MLYCLQSFENIHFTYTKLYGFMLKILEEISVFLIYQSMYACLKLLTMELYFTTFTLIK